MECRTVERKLSALVDGELFASESRPVRDHLRSCQACRGAYEEMKRAGRLIKSLPEPVLSVNFRPNFWQQAEALKKYRTRPWFAWLPIPAVGLLGVFLAINIVIFNQSLSAKTPDLGHRFVRHAVESVNRPGRYLNVSALSDFCKRCSRLLCEGCRESGLTDSCLCGSCGILPENNKEHSR